MNSRNGFSVNVKVDRSYQNKLRENGYNYVPLTNGSWYSVVLQNDNSTRCDVELFIDDIKMGKWRIDPHNSVELNRPTNTDNKFYFVEENGMDAALGNVVAGSQSNGVITATFYPEEYVDRPIAVDDYLQFNTVVPSVNGLEFNAPTRAQNNCYGAQCFRAALGSGASVMNEHVAPLSRSYSYGSGATVLKGRSNQRFGRSPPLVNIDSSRVTELSLRLVVDRNRYNDTVRPLTYGDPVRAHRPPRVDGWLADPYMYDDFGHCDCHVRPFQHGITRNMF